MTYAAPVEQRQRGVENLRGVGGRGLGFGGVEPPPPRPGHRADVADRLFKLKLQAVAMLHRELDRVAPIRPAAMAADVGPVALGARAPM